MIILMKWYINNIKGVGFIRLLLLFFFNNLTLLLKLKEKMERYQMINIIMQDIYFMILKEYLYQYHLIIFIILNIMDINIHHYILYVLIIVILLELLALLVLIQEEIMLLVLDTV